MNAAKRKALDAMAAGSPLYVYVESCPHLLDRGRKIHGGTILSDEGPVGVSARIVSAILNLGTEWHPGYRAKVLTADARLRARGRDVISL